MQEEVEGQMNTSEANEMVIGMCKDKGVKELNL